jgi:hypothetical protein
MKNSAVSRIQYGQQKNSWDRYTHPLLQERVEQCTPSPADMDRTAIAYWIQMCIPWSG